MYPSAFLAFQQHYNHYLSLSLSLSHSPRLQDLVRGVYGERLRLRKHMVDLDTQERETLLRICRKVYEKSAYCIFSFSYEKAMELYNYTTYNNMYIHIYIHYLRTLLK